jgi:mRNA-degrading endonuclease toxin of MazEF toxin-antitoxin module
VIQRGDIVLADFPYTDRRVSKVRPARVVQNDADNARRRKTVIGLLTNPCLASTMRDAIRIHLLQDHAHRKSEVSR